MKIKLKTMPVQAAKPFGAYSPTKESIESVWGEITKYGIKIMSDGKQWVLHGLTGQPIERRLCYPLAASRGLFIWVPNGTKLSPVDQPHVSVWRNP